MIIASGATICLTYEKNFMEGKSKLRAFLNKAKKKQTESATTSDVAETSEATQQVAGLVVIPEHSSESPVAVAIDGVQPKV